MASTAKPNRTDLAAQPIRTQPGGEYGSQAAQAQSQQAVPMAGAASTQQGRFARPTDRPTEPITAGMPIGAGPGPEVIGAGDEYDGIRAAYMKYPSESLRRILERRDAVRGP